jgi:hypothetical protein
MAFLNKVFRFFLFIIIIQIGATGGLLAAADYNNLDQGIKSEIGKKWVTIEVDGAEDEFSFEIESYVFSMSKFWFWNGFQLYFDVTTMQASTDEEQLGYSSWLGGMRLGYNLYVDFSYGAVDLFVCSEKIRGYYKKHYDETNVQNCLQVDSDPTKVSDYKFVWGIGYVHRIPYVDYWLLEWTTQSISSLKPTRKYYGDPIILNVMQTKLTLGYYF